MTRRLLRAPALHFLAAGAFLFALRAWWGGAPPPVEPIALSADDVAGLRAAWAAEHGEPPDAATERQLIEQTIDDDVLLREALAAGIDRRDPLVRSRLADLERYLADVSEDGGDAAAREAQRLGLEATDVVVRRHLVGLMRLALSRPAAADLPSDAELEEYLAARAERFTQPARVRLSHVFVSRDRHGATLARQAERLLARLRDAGTGPAAAAARGDPFLRGAHLPAASEADLDRIFGSGFAAALRDAPPAAWSGPIASSYGLHLVWIHERTAPRLPRLDEVRAQVTHEVLEARGRARLRDRLDALRARYQVAVER